MRRRLATHAAVIGLAGIVSQTSGDLVLSQRQAYVMGTRVEISVFARDSADGRRRLESALTSLEATDAELSTWKTDSAVSEINRLRIGQPHRLPPALCRLLGELDKWRLRTDGAFDPGIGALTDAWGIHADGRIPTEEDLQHALARSGLRHFDFDPGRCSVARRNQATLDVGAFGKGEGLDRAAAALSPLPWMIDFGGQVSVHGAPPGQSGWSVRIADPRDRSRGVMTLTIGSGSLSTSAGSERDRYTGNLRIGHILDPRTGRPASYSGSVSVWHARGLVADILSTALYVMGPLEGSRWAESQGIAAMYLVPTATGLRPIATPALRRLQPSIELE